MSRVLPFFLSLLCLIPLPAAAQDLLFDYDIAADLSPEQEARLAALAAQPAAVAARVVAVSPDVRSASALVFNAPNGDRFDLVLDDGFADLNAPSARNFRAADEGAQTSAIFVDPDGLVSGALYGAERVFEVRPFDDLHVVIEYDNAGFPEEHPESGAIMAPDTGEPQPDLPEVAEDQATTVDVLVVYTPAAATAYGGPIQSHANAAVTSANTVYRNSGMAVRLRLVGAEMVDYAEAATMGEDLDRLAATGDGALDAVHPLRDATRADLVHMIVARSGPCGLGFVSARRSSAFALSTVNCAIPNLSFAHEVGHNFGACHDTGNSTGCTPAMPDGFGFQHPQATFRTVMSYQCPNGSCPRRPIHSHPTDNGVAGKHNVRRLIIQRAPIVAGFK